MEQITSSQMKVDTISTSEVITMAIDLYDHPEIESMIRTGYPTWCQPKTIYCDCCGEDISDDAEIYEDYYYENLCMNCLLSLHEKR